MRHHILDSSVFLCHKNISQGLYNVVKKTNKQTNIIYFTAITQKVHGTRLPILEGVDVGIFWPKEVEETKDPAENHQLWTDWQTSVSTTTLSFYSVIKKG